MPQPNTITTMTIAGGNLMKIASRARSGRRLSSPFSEAFQNVLRT
jgi:hypothetical protein